MVKLDIQFFARNTLDVAKDLLGKVIKVNNKYGLIFETEAYRGLDDPASHAYPRKTERNKYMYETYGYVYVYLIYGVHYCLNFTTEKNYPGAVLIRGIYGFYSLSDLYKFENYSIIDGPGKLTKFLGIDKSFNGLNLENTELIGVFDILFSFDTIINTSRIGISKAKDKLWRFVGKN